MRWKAVIFDMDGTVLNTLDDLLGAINYAMEQGGHRHDFPPEEGRYFAGSGVANSMRRALALEAGMDLADLEQIGKGADPDASAPEEAEAMRLLRIFRPYYDAHCNDSTRPYEGIVELMERLRGAGVPMAIVSNKPDGTACDLSREHFAGAVDFCIGEREGIPRKPAADMVDIALRELGVTDRADAVYVGDSEVDLQTAANAGLDCIAAEWGFRGRDFLLSHGAQIIAASPQQVAQLVLGVNTDDRLINRQEQSHDT